MAGDDLLCWIRLLQHVESVRKVLLGRIENRGDLFARARHAGGSVSECHAE